MAKDRCEAEEPRGQERSWCGAPVYSSPAENRWRANKIREKGEHKYFSFEI